jgi:hypothetical protein
MSGVKTRRLSQFVYGAMVFRTGFEPAASAVSTRRSDRAELPERERVWESNPPDSAYEAVEHDRCSYPQCAVRGSNSGHSA